LLVQAYVEFQQENRNFSKIPHFQQNFQQEFQQNSTFLNQDTTVFTNTRSILRYGSFKEINHHQ